MEYIEGIVNTIIYKNSASNFYIFSLEIRDAQELNEHCQVGINIVVKGTFLELREHEYIRVYGSIIQDKKYGTQFQSETYEFKMPHDLTALKDYLGSGIIKGIGPVLAKRIIDTFGSQTLDILEKEPAKLAQVKGISRSSATLFQKRMAAQAQTKNAILFLSKYGISPKLGFRIYNYYKEEMYHVLQTNPYKLSSEIRGVGFKKADEIALNGGISPNSVFRIQSGIQYVLSQGTASGHVYLPLQTVLSQATAILNVSEDEIQMQLKELSVQGDISIINRNLIPCVYLTRMYNKELRSAKMLCDLKYKDQILDCEQIVRNLEKKSNIQLDELQRLAVITAASSGVMILTGGPGTGKTATTNLIIKYFESAKKEVLLAAPTGRAAKRMSESTGKYAQTIHRLLEVTADESGYMSFQRNMDNPLECDVVIVDEFSMVDQDLFYSLLSAIARGTQLIMVGDQNQLPSVGAGSVLKDIIDSKVFPVIELKKIFRQAENSDIIVNAHKILNGNSLRLRNKETDFFFKSCETAEDITENILHYTDTLQPYLGVSSADIQVLSPTRRRNLGTESLNLALQEKINPPQSGKTEVKIGFTTFRISDKVMQTKNNYNMIRLFPSGQKEEGVFNGDIGVIKTIDDENDIIEILFEDGSVAKYTHSNMTDVELAYAITIHKSQGSEYKVVIIPIYDYIPMLTTMNAIYTAITRAKKCLVLVGNYNTFMRMLSNRNQIKRYTSLCEEIQEYSNRQGVK